MSADAFEFDYQPTDREVRIGSRLICRSIYKGGWHWARFGLGALNGASYVVLGALVSVMVIRAMGETIESQFLLYNLGFIGIAAAALVFHRIVAGHSARSYVLRTLPKKYRVHLSQDGIVFRSSHSDGRTGWPDVNDVVRGKGVTVLVLGNTGMILPDRLVARAGDPAEINQRMSSWFDASRGAAR